MTSPWPCFICGKSDLCCGHWERDLLIWLRAGNIPKDKSREQAWLDKQVAIDKEQRSIAARRAA